MNKIFFVWPCQLQWVCLSKGSQPLIGLSNLIALSVLETPHISIRGPVSQMIKSVIRAILLLWETRHTRSHKYHSYWWQWGSLLSLAVFVSDFLDHGTDLTLGMSLPFMVKNVFYIWNITSRSFYGEPYWTESLLEWVRLYIMYFSMAGWQILWRILLYLKKSLDCSHPK